MCCEIFCYTKQLLNELFGGIAHKNNAFFLFMLCVQFVEIGSLAKVFSDNGVYLPRMIYPTCIRFKVEAIV